jgi:beta-1,4-mannosyltransferase
VRPYKNLEELVDAAGDVPPSELEVAIVGKRHDPAYAAALEARAAAHPALRFALSDGVIGQDVLDAAIDDAHGIVLPYRRILNSGSAILALSRARPVLVPAAGSMPELARMVGRDWVRLYEGALTPAVLRDFAAHLGTIPAGAAPDLSAISWDRVTQDLRGFLGRLFRSPHHSTLEAGDADANRETVRHAPDHARHG